MERTAATVIGAIIVGAAFVLASLMIGWAFDKGLTAQEVVECTKWGKMAESIPAYSEKNPGGFYLLSWEKAQCESIGMPVAAVVKK